MGPMMATTSKKILIGGSDFVEEHQCTDRQVGRIEFKCNLDRFETLKEVTKAIREEGVEKCGLIFGIDFSLSNRRQGQTTFDGYCLHDIAPNKINPYQEVITILGETLESLDDDGIIPTFGFGDSEVKDKGIFPLKKDGELRGFGQVYDAYSKVAGTIHLGGPTNFAPLIEKAYHILVIAADGQVSNEEATVQAIVNASKYALSIIMIGVGDGPWDTMHEFDTKLTDRKFDNFHFVDFHRVKNESRNSQAAFALAALMEIPSQYKSIKKLRYLT